MYCMKKEKKIFFESISLFILRRVVIVILELKGDFKYYGQETLAINIGYA